MGRRKEKREVGQTSATREMMETQEKSEIDQMVDHVKKMIERCLMLHMNKKQTVETLWKEEKVQCAFTETVWEGLQHDNPDFFPVYHLRLLLKEQIAVFNMLLEKQANSMGIPRKSVCSRCGTALLHQWGAIYVRCAKCSTIFSVTPQEKVQEHATGHASTSLAAQYVPSNANPLSAIKYGGSSGNPNIQVGAGDLFPAERMGITGRIREHATGHSSTSLATQYMHANPLSAIKYGRPSGNPNIRVGAGDLFPSETMGIRGRISDHATGHASTSSAAQCMPSNENPLSANEYGGSSGNPNIQVGAGDLFPADRMDITVKIPEHATGHASTSLAAQYMPSNANPLSATTYGGSSGNPNIQVGSSDLFPAERMGFPGKNPDHASTSLAAQCMPSNGNPLSGADDLFSSERMGIPGKIPQHVTGHASTCLAAENVPSHANSLSAIKYGVSSGHPNINIGTHPIFPAERLCISADIPGTETLRMQISHEVTGTANKSYPSFMRNSGSGGDDLLAIQSSTGDADGASSHQFEMSGKPSTELPLNADTSFRFSVPQGLADILPDVDESLFGLSGLSLDKLSEYLVEHGTDQSGSPDQIPELFSSPDLISDEHASPSLGADGVSSSIIPDGSSGHQRIQEDGNASVPAHGLSISTSMLATENSNTGTFPQVIGTANMTDDGYQNNSGLALSTDINQSGSAPDSPFKELELAEQPCDKQILYTHTASFELENQIPQTIRFSNSTSADSDN
ncbi:uncharacterized protein [Elaeis guineensis]|uniref:uncharacterized protein isoform X3 n=1 Tax=Elaeis guineensis var. tenera TaxID=51953 RepID=UPI003C6D062D